MLSNKDYCIIVQARENSKRFPKKILKKVGNITVLEILIRKLKLLKNIKTIYAIPKKNNKNLKKILIKNNCEIFYGPELNVLKRYFLASKNIPTKKIIRITSDCPLIDTNIIKQLIKVDKKKNFDYCCNNHPRTYPHGYDFEIFKKKLLYQAYFNTKKKYDLEHVTPYIQRHAKKKFNFKNNKDLSHIRITLDYKSDLKIISKIIRHFDFKIDIFLKDIEIFFQRLRS